MGEKPERGGEDESPVHTVNLKKFYISESEVTVDQWKRFLDEGETDWDKWKDVKGFSPAGNYPICFVTWEDARDFCNWLSEKEERQYRLPTEAEWEYAARGGLIGNLYPWGDSTPDGKSCNFADKREFEKEKDVWADTNCDDGYAFCAPVKKYPPNKYGLFDMAGNVWEWCQDWYCLTYYKESPTQDPTGPETGRLRVLRGGAWSLHKDMLRVSNRYGAAPKTGTGFTGFRIVAVEE